MFIFTSLFVDIRSIPGALDEALPLCQRFRLSPREKLYNLVSSIFDKESIYFILTNLVDWNVSKVDWNVSKVDWNISKVDWNVSEVDWKVSKVDWNVSKVDWNVSKVDWNVSKVDWNVSKVEWNVSKVEWNISKVDWWTLYFFLDNSTQLTLQLSVIRTRATPRRADAPSKHHPRILLLLIHPNLSFSPWTMTWHGRSITWSPPSLINVWILTDVLSKPPSSCLLPMI